MKALFVMLSVLALAGCGSQAAPPTVTAAAAAGPTAPVTFTHQSVSAAARSSHPPTPTDTAASYPTSMTATTPPPPTAADPQLPPELTSRDRAAIDPTKPDQVACAYLIYRLSYSYTDRDAAEHIQLANRYTLHPAAPPPATSPAWQKVIEDQVRATTHISSQHYTPTTRTSPGDQLLIRLTWTRTLTNRHNAAQRTSGATTITVTAQQDGTWAVADDGFAAAN